MLTKILVISVVLVFFLISLMSNKTLASECKPMAGLKEDVIQKCKSKAPPLGLGSKEVLIGYISPQSKGVGHARGIKRR